MAAPLKVIDPSVWNLKRESGESAEPTSSGATQELAASKEISASSTGIVAVEPVNILLVDDDSSKLLAHESILEGLGQKVIRATSGRAALEILLKMEFAVILLDVNLPDIDGFEIASLILQRPRLERTPIIFVTGYNTSDLDRLKGYGIGAVDYLFLPVVPEVLKAKVQVFVELAQQRQIMRKQAEELAQRNEQQQEQIQVIQGLHEKLHRAYEQLESFSYTVSHDLRSPLRALEGYSQILLQDFKDHINEEAEDYLQRINKAAIRMDALVRDVLAYTRISKAEVRTEAVDLQGLIEDLIKENQNLRLTRARVHVHTPLHNVIAHVGCLTQCLSNLLDNASKFVEPATVPEIAIRTERHETAVRVWIEDNGIGIDPLIHDRIFNMFERGEAGVRYEGTGIGLAIVKKAVEQMGGAVGLESSLGVGSRFWIDLPPASQ